MPQQTSQDLLRMTLIRLAPGTPLREGVERIVRGRTGALILLGSDQVAETICDGGFTLDVELTPTRLRELAKMDGALVLSCDGTRIVRANAHLIPDSSIPTAESGTRHRTAERAAVHTGHAVISVSQSMGIVSIYCNGLRRVLRDSVTVLAKANQALSTLENWRTKFDQLNRKLLVAEIRDSVTPQLVVALFQRLELIRRLIAEITEYLVELGIDGHLVDLRLNELSSGISRERELAIRDYLAASPTSTELTEANAMLHSLTTEQLANPASFTEVFPDFDSSFSYFARPYGYRILAKTQIPAETQQKLITRYNSIADILSLNTSEIVAQTGLTAVTAKEVHAELAQLARLIHKDQVATPAEMELAD